MPDRIKCPENLLGALYEVRVAAALLRAGFSLQPQDETDRRTTYVEFIATDAKSRAIYAVEAKRREGARMKTNRQMNRALSKKPDHPRIVFIDTNDGRLELGRGQPKSCVCVHSAPENFSSRNFRWQPFWPHTHLSKNSFYGELSEIQPALVLVQASKHCDG